MLHSVINWCQNNTFTKMLIWQNLFCWLVVSQQCWAFSIRDKLQEFNALIGGERDFLHVQEQEIEDELGNLGSINLATFNIQVFGVTKMSKPHVVDLLLQILSRSHMIAIQEIRDSSQTAFPDLVNQLKKYSGKNYLGLAGPRQGRSSSKEQYGFIYRSDIMAVKDQWSYPDLTDDFERPPFVVQFELIQPVSRKGYYISFCNIHTKPDNAVDEISNLVNVYDAYVERSKNSNMVILGDFNADCSYVCKSCWDRIELWTDSRFTWLVDNSFDTTTGKSDCAYDRIVVAGDWIQKSACCAAAFDYEHYYGIDHELALEVSDHYPVDFKMN